LARSGDRLRIEVRLEQERFTTRPLNGKIDLEKRSEVNLKAVLGSDVLGHLGNSYRSLVDFKMVVIELVDLTDEPLGVGIDDRPIRCPQLDSHDSITEKVFIQVVIELTDRVGIQSQQFG